MSKSNFDSPQYPQKFLNCLAASIAINEENPVNALQSSRLNHGIKEVIASKSFDKCLDIKYMICDFSTEENKQLLVAFGETEFMNDFLLHIQHFGDIDGCKGGFHSSIHQRSLQIPIQFFIKKIIEENYEITFTGHRLGASIASIVGARIMFHNEMKDTREKVFFIGFDSPPFVNDEFNSFINKESGTKERFHFYIDEDELMIQLLDTFLNILYFDQSLYSKEDMISNLESLMSDILNRKEIFDLYKYKGSLKFIVPFEMKPSFHLFGLLLNTNGEIKQTMSPIRFWRNINYYFKTGCFISDTEQSNIEKYFHLLENKNLKEQTRKSKIGEVKDISNQLFLPKMTSEAYKVEFVKNEFKTDIFLTIFCENKEFICQIDLILFYEILPQTNIQYNSDSICFIFLCPNELLMERIRDYEYKLYVREMMVGMEGGKDDSLSSMFKCVLTSHFNQINFEFNHTHFKPGFNKKQEYIENMELDLLYLSAVFYANIFKNCENERLRNRCKELNQILLKIDEIWNLDKNIKHDYNEKKGKAKLFASLKNHFGDYLNKLIKDNESFKEKFVNLNEFLNINEWAENKLNGYDEENCFKNLLLDIMPTCKELQKKQEKASLVDFYAYIYKTKSFAESFLSTIGFPIVLLTYFLSANYEKHFGYTIALKSYFGPISNSSYCEIKEPIIKYVGCYERAIVEAIKADTYEDNTNDKILQTIKLNRKIRDIFCADFQFGVIGRKKCGKSSFIQTILPNIKVPDADAKIGTTKLTPYRLTDSVTLNDYPHFDSTDISHKIQFFFTRFLIDHIFFICEAKERMDSEATMDIFDLIKDGCGDHFTILLNRIDDCLKDCVTHEDYGIAVLENLKNECLVKKKSGRRSIGIEHENKVLFTCFRRIDATSELVEIDRMKKTNCVLMDEKVREIVKEIVLNKLPKNEKILKEREALEKTFALNKSKHKLVWIKNKNMTFKYCLQFSETSILKIDGFDTINSFKELIENLKENGFKNPVIRAHLGEDIIISSMIDFKKIDYHTFKVENKKSNYDDSKHKKIKIETENGEDHRFLIITLDKPNCESIQGVNKIDSFECLEDQFYSRRKPNPSFILKSDRNTKISTLEDFFKTEEDTFLVVYA